MTASKPSKSDRDAYGVDLFGVNAFGADHGGDVASRRFDRDRIESASADELEQPVRPDHGDDVAAAREAAIGLLAQRDHSIDELRRKLKKRGYAVATIAIVVASLDATHSVSDVRFAESFVRVRSERGQGPLRIRAELRERGVTDVVVDEVMTATADFWLERAQKARLKRFGGAPPVDRDAWNRQARFLAQRGFPADLIYRTLGAVRG
jgi:regulatory protein